MLERLTVFALLTVLALLFASIYRWRTSSNHEPLPGLLPSQVDRADFPQSQFEWLVMVFSSADCGACVRTIDKAKLLAGDCVAYAEVGFSDNAKLHKKYGIDYTPVTLIADDQGSVKASFVGEPASAELWATMAALRS